MYENYAKEYFEMFKGTDADYLLICREHGSGRDWAYARIPCEDYWETIEEAIQWHFANDWDIVEIYDLYAQFEKSMIRNVSI